MRRKWGSGMTKRMAIGLVVVVAIAATAVTVEPASSQETDDEAVEPQHVSRSGLAEQRRAVAAPARHVQHALPGRERGGPRIARQVRPGELRPLGPRRIGALDLPTVAGFDAKADSILGCERQEAA